MPAELLPSGTERVERPVLSARQAWTIVAAGVLLVPVLLADADWPLAGPLGQFFRVLAPGCLIVIMVGTAAAAAGRRRMIIAGTVGLLVLAALAAAALPAVLRQLGPRGSGLIWVAGVAGPPAEAVPLGVLDDTAVIDARDRSLFLDLADGSLVGTVPLDPREDRPVLVPTGVLVRSAAGFQLYDRTGRARWPAPVEAQQALAHAGGVTVLTSCWGGSCGLAGYDSAGTRIWRFEAGYDAIHRPLPDTVTTALPSQVAVRTRSDRAETLRWTLHAADTGRSTGHVQGDSLRLIGKYAVTLTGFDHGPCLVAVHPEPLDAGPDEAVDCSSPWSTRVRDGLLVVERPAGHASVIRPGPKVRGGEWFDLATVLGERSDAAVGTLAGVRLDGRTVRAWHWNGFDSAARAPSWRAEVPRLGEPGVLLDGSAVLVLGDAADGPLGVGADESELSVLDLADGTETARLRLGRTDPSGLRILGVGPGRLLLCRPDAAPLLLGRPD